MFNELPINLADLLRQRTVEGDWIEYKAGWNPDAVLRTLCAFANDFENIGGRDVIIGQDCGQDRHPQMPDIVMLYVEAHDASMDTEVRNLELLRVDVRSPPANHFCGVAWHKAQQGQTNV